MLKLTCVLLTIVAGGLGDAVTDGTTLEMTFLIHRHGDRTPVADTIAMTTDPDAVNAASAQYGYGQLTDAGNQRAYKLGEYIRERYSSLLSPQYNRSEIYIRSTDSTRTKMTVLTAMAAVYPTSRGSWSKKINWTPVPYTTVPARYDFNLANMNCPNYLSSFSSAMLTNPSSMDQYADVMEVLAEVNGVSLLTSYPVLAYAYYDAYVSQISLGIPVTDEIADIMPRLSEAAGAALSVMLSENITLMAGVLLNEFFTYASNVTSGDDTPRVRIYSAHDMNVYALAVASKVTSPQGVPKYSSSLALELRTVIKTGKRVVLVVYKPDPSEDVVYLPVAGCDLLCDLDQFRELVSENLLDEDTWRSDCGYTDDLVIDDSSLA